LTKVTVDKTETGAGIADSRITITVDNIAIDGRASGTDFPEASVVHDDGSVKWGCSIELFLIDKTCD
jgi:hypothetical protein